MTITSDQSNRTALVRRLRRLAERQFVLISRSMVPKRRPRPKPMQGDVLRRLARLQAALHIRDKRQTPVVRRPRRLAMPISELGQLDRRLKHPRGQ